MQQRFTQTEIQTSWKNLSGIIFKKMYINAFLCILLSSVAAIDFDSEYLARRGAPRTEIAQE